MSSVKDFVSLLQDKSKIELKDTTDLIEKTIKNVFQNIQTELISNIKSNVQDELIKKLSNFETNEEIEKIVISNDAVINKYLKDICTNDEYIITYKEISSYWYDQNNFNNFIACTNYNNTYTLQITGPHYNTHPKLFKQGKNIKITKSFIFLVKELWTQLYKIGSFVHRFNSGSGFGSYDATSDNNKTFNTIGILMRDIPNIIYEIQEKYFAHNKYGVYGSKFEEIINQFHKTKKELENKNMEFEKQKEEILRLKEENSGLKKELEDCDQLKHCLANLRNTFITS